MQDVVTIIGEKIHELINNEIQRRFAEGLKLLDEFENRLALLEKQVTVCPCEKVISAMAEREQTTTRYRIKGVNIISIRTRLVLSQAMFARLLGVDRSCVNRWEHDKVKPSQQTMAMIAEYRNLGKKVLTERLQKLEEEVWNN